MKGKNSTVVEVNHAVAMAWGAEAGLPMLRRLASQADGFYPHPVARADLLLRTMLMCVCVRHVQQRRRTRLSTAAH